MRLQWPQALVLLFLSSYAALHCSFNVVAPGNFLGPINGSTPTLTSLHDAVEFVAHAVASGRALLSSSPVPDVAVCIFGRHVLSRPLIIDIPNPRATRVEWIGFGAEISGAIALLSWTLVADSNGTFVTKLPPSFAGVVVRVSIPAI